MTLLNSFTSFYKLPLLTIVVCITSCKLYNTPPSTEEVSQTALPQNTLIPDTWQQDSLHNDSVLVNWYKEFNDTLLNNYISEALDSANPSIVYRLARIRSSKASIQLARAGRAVYVDYLTGYSGAYATKTPNIDDIGVGAPISWEADLWGKIGAGIQAANENMVSEIHQLQYTKISIAAEVATYYFSIGTQYELLEIADQFIKLNENILSLLKVRERVGITDAKEIHLAQAKLNDLKNIVTQNENKLQKSARELEVVLGRYPSNDLLVNWRPKEISGEIELSNPYSLLRHRPDVLALENQVRKTFYLREQAILAKYPSLTLSVMPGLSLTNGFFVNPAVSLMGPILNGKSIKAQIEQLDAIHQQLIANYGSAVLQAYNEVESSINSIELLKEQLEYVKNVSEEYGKVYQIAVEQYKVGKIDLYDVLLIQSQYLAAKIDVVNLMLLTHTQKIQLHLSLGGTISN